MHALAGDTDGVDGQEEIAGALLAPDTLARACGAGIKPARRLDDNDGHGFFEALGDSVVTGPTLTNVNDFRAILSSTVRHGRCREPDDDNAPPPQRQDRRDPGTGERRPRDDRGAVRCRRRRVPAQLQPRHARGPPSASRHHPRDRARQRAGRSACCSTCRDRSCGSARFADGPITLAKATRSGSISTRRRPATATRVCAAASRDLRGARARHGPAARRRPGALAGRALRAGLRRHPRRHGGTLSDRKGVNVPGVVLPLSAMTEKDRRDLAFGLTLGVDWVALSFVQRAEDIVEVRDIVGGRAGIVAKLEKPAAIAAPRRDRRGDRRRDGRARRPRRGDAGRAGAGDPEAHRSRVPPAPASPSSSRRRCSSR